jgi:hypothetical protein
VNNGLWRRLWEAVRRAAARVARFPYVPPVRVPASALVAMLPGKASPLVFGGKIHTPADTPDRVYPQPLRESLLVLDYFVHRMEGGERIREPRTLDEYHYARLYRVNGGHLLVLKDAIEPNRRNVNGVYRAHAVVEGKRATVNVGEIVTWGVHPRLRDQVAEVCAQRGWIWERERVDEMDVAGEGLHLRFERRLSPWQLLAKAGHRLIADLDGLVKDWTFASYFILAYLLGQVLDVAFSVLFALWPASAVWFAGHAVPAMVGIVILELALLVYLMARRIPTWVDNGYRHENRADNLGSLRRVAAR